VLKLMGIPTDAQMIVDSAINSEEKGNAAAQQAGSLSSRAKR
jgi:hypothetical protein